MLHQKSAPHPLLSEALFFCKILSPIKFNREILCFIHREEDNQLITFSRKVKYLNQKKDTSISNKPAVAFLMLIDASVKIKTP